MTDNENPKKGPSANNPNRKKLAVAGLTLLLVGLIATFYLRYVREEPLFPPTSTSAPAPAPENEVVASDQVIQKLETDDKGVSLIHGKFETTQGVIEIRFFPKDAPNTVRRIVELMKSGFYNGIKFHRVVPDFVVQGGDPTGTGGGGSGQKLKAEFNQRKHKPGSIAMARTPDPDSADSQFYICLNDLPQLDGAYTVFGQVVKGMDVVKKIKMGDKIIRSSIITR